MIARLALAAARAHRASLGGSFAVVVLASALLAATGVLFETGIRGGESMLTAVASSFAGTMLLVVVLVVGSTFAAALRQRARQFALLRAVGATASQIHRMVAVELAVVFAVGVPLGAVPGLFAARLLVPTLESGGVLSPGATLVLSPLPVLAAALVLAPMVLLAARVAAREIVRAAVTDAVRGAAVESPALSPVRRHLAWWTTGFGLLAALAPLVMTGTLGAATGAVSALLLVTAAALAGPAIVGAGARAAVRFAPTGSSAVALAVRNARGHSRRLTAAVVPLALLLALGTVQSSTDAALVAGAVAQLEAGTDADLVVPGPLGEADLAALEAIEGVEAVVATRAVPIEVKVDAEESPVFGDLSWEAGGLLVVPADVDSVIDLDVTAGSLADLERPGTVAVAADALLGFPSAVGDSIEVRHEDGSSGQLEIVATYTRGLGFGGIVVGEHDDASTREVAYVRTAPGALDATRAGIGSLGFDAIDLESHIEAASSAGAGEQQLSQVLLLALLAFLGVACVNTLVMLTVQRRREFDLLHRTGATRRQLLGMASAESALVAGGALVIGALAVAPAIVAVGLSLGGGIAVDATVLGSLAGAVVVIAVVSILGAAVRTTRAVQVG